MQVVAFVELYRQAQSRAIVCAGRGGKGLSFNVQDRATLGQIITQTGKTVSQLAYVLAEKLGGTHGMHFHRLASFKRQVEQGAVRSAGPLKAEPQAGVTVIKSPIHKDIQAMFDQAAVRLVKCGVTDEQAAQSYLSRAFIKVRTDQKIESKAERISQELRMGDLDKAQVMEVLARVQKSF